MITVYARKEPTTDSATQDMLKSSPELFNAKTMQDVQVYHDRECTQKYARWPWHYSSKPTKRNKAVTINCFRYRLVWVTPA
jgi:hypothetical protein